MSGCGVAIVDGGWEILVLVWAVIYCLRAGGVFYQWVGVQWVGIKIYGIFDKCVVYSQNNILHMSQKRNKSIASRVRKTKSGALLIRRKGQGHFNAKESRSKQLRRKRSSVLAISKKAEQLYNITK